MITRTNRKTVTFSNAFALDGVDRILPAGSYDVVTDEELIEGLSFPVYRRLATSILVPTKSASSVEMVNVDPCNLATAEERDALTIKAGTAPAKG